MTRTNHGLFLEMYVDLIIQDAIESAALKQISSSSSSSTSLLKKQADQEWETKKRMSIGSSPIKQGEIKDWVAYVAPNSISSSNKRSSTSNIIFVNEKEKIITENIPKLRVDDDFGDDEQEKWEIMKGDTIPRNLTSEEVGKIRNKPGNRECVDCGSPNPEWASVSNGVLLCLRCSGIHRGFGVQISFVRSLVLDLWSYDTQTLRLINGGNRQFLDNTNSATSAAKRYNSDSAELYRQQLTSKCKGEPIPTSLEFSIQTNNTNSSEISSGSQLQQQFKSRPYWQQDAEVTACTLCNRKFTQTFRKHHCRNCGKIICSRCSPPLNSKPIPKYNYSEPVRHCIKCYKSPFIDWEAQDKPISFSSKFASMFFKR